jgi:hypothetical protein
MLYLSLLDDCHCEIIPLYHKAERVNSHHEGHNPWYFIGGRHDEGAQLAKQISAFTHV